jgi:hypothetical protein
MLHIVCIPALSLSWLRHISFAHNLLLLPLHSSSFLAVRRTQSFFLPQSRLPRRLSCCRSTRTFLPQSRLPRRLSCCRSTRTLFYPSPQSSTSTLSCASAHAFPLLAVCRHSLVCAGTLFFAPLHYFFCCLMLSCCLSVFLAARFPLTPPQSSTTLLESILPRFLATTEASPTSGPAPPLVLVPASVNTNPLFRGTTELSDRRNLPQPYSRASFRCFSPPLKLRPPPVQRHHWP